MESSHYVQSPRLGYGLERGQVPEPAPKLSWVNLTPAADWWQQAAEIELTLGQGEPHVAHIDGGHSVFVEWPFAPLAPRQEGVVRVRTKGPDGWSAWSSPTRFFTSFLGAGQWRAKAVGLLAPQRHAQPVLLRREFMVRPGLRRATWYATAEGVAQTYVNGHEVDDQFMKPGWTPYRLRLVHETTDVTALLAVGQNAIGVALAGGWFTESYGFQGQAQPHYGTQPSYAAQLLLEYLDGSHEWIVTDTTWLATGDGPWVSSGLYAGEVFDARRIRAGWAEPGFDSTGWAGAEERPDVTTPGPRTSPVVRVTQQLPVKEVSRTPSGKLLLDFGQNLVGRLRIRVRGAAGDTVTLRHAEVLENGELGTRPLRVAAATDRYTLVDGEQEWAPAFTFHGFRYATIEGWPGQFDRADVVAEVIGSDMRRTGWLTSSHELVNRLHENVVWSMRGNFLYLPTDCPQRDERLGWTGDIQAFAPTAAFLYDCDAFLASWLTDLALEQEAAGGSVAFTIPDVLGSGDTPTAAWGDTATVVPSTLYERFGDLATLARQYPSMKAWTELVLDLAGQRGLWEGSYQWGDWVDPDAPPEDPARGKTDPDLVASAFVYRSAQLLAEAAELLGHTRVAQHFTAEAERVRTAWLAEYATPAGRLVSDAQTAYALAIVFGLATDELTEAFGRRLNELVRLGGYRISTGFVGTPLVTEALTDTGHDQAAARMLLQTECPSWLYSVRMGATTVWERWDSMLEDGSINPGEMTSFNHYALGSVADWLHRKVAGLAPAAPGYRIVAVEPHPLPGLEHISACLDGPYGRIEVGWRRTDNHVEVRALIPPNSQADVTLPGQPARRVGSGNYCWTIPDPFASPRLGAVTLETPLAEVIDDPEAYATVLAVFEDISPEVGRDFKRRTRWSAAQPLSSCIRLVSPKVGSALAARLAELNERRHRDESTLA